MGNDALFDRLADIHSRLVEVRDWAKDRGDLEMASTIVMVGADLNNLVVDARLRRRLGDDTFQRLSAINDRLIQLCDWLNDKQDLATACRLIPITDDLTRLVAEISIENP